MSKNTKYQTIWQRIKLVFLNQVPVEMSRRIPAPIRTFFQRLFCTHNWYKAPPWEQRNAPKGTVGWYCMPCGKNKFLLPGRTPDDRSFRKVWDRW